MYIVFFVILAVLGYGSLFWRDKPLLLLLGIIATTVLMLTPLDGSVVISTEFDSTWAGTEQGTATDLDRTGSDDLVILALDPEGWDFQVWLWLHVAILIIQSVSFFGMLMRAIT
jgi:hypothetical protein